MKRAKGYAGGVETVRGESSKGGKAETAHQLRDMLARNGTGREKLRILEGLPSGASAADGIAALRDKLPANHGTIPKAEALAAGRPVPDVGIRVHNIGEWLKDHPSHRRRSPVSV